MSKTTRKTDRTSIRLKCQIPLLAVICVLAPHVFAKPLPIVDPGRILDQTDSFLNMISFDDAFRPDDWAKFVITQCESSCNVQTGECHETCGEPSTTELRVVQVEKDLAVVAGENGSQEYSRAEYNKIGGNPLRWFLNNTAEQFGNPRRQSSSHKIRFSNSLDQIRVDRGDLVEFELGGAHAPNPGAKVSAYRLDITILVEWSQFPLAIYALIDGPAVARLARTHFFPSISKTPGFNLVEFGRAP